MKIKKKPGTLAGKSGQEQKTNLMPQSITKPNNCQMVSGFGQHHTANPTTKNPKSYIPITLEKIYQMAADPNSMVKEDAQWTIPSTTINDQSRVHKYQRENGNFPLLWADIDKVHGLTYLDVKERIKRAFNGFKYLI